MSPDSEGKPEIFLLSEDTEDGEEGGVVTCIVSPVVLAVLSVGQLRGGHHPEVEDSQGQGPSAQHQGGQAVGGGVD